MNTPKHSSSIHAIYFFLISCRNRIVWRENPLCEEIVFHVWVLLVQVSVNGFAVIGNIKASTITKLGTYACTKILTWNSKSPFLSYNYVWFDSKPQQNSSGTPIPLCKLQFCKQSYDLIQTTEKKSHEILIPFGKLQSLWSYSKPCSNNWVIQQHARQD